jgi:hypothetical protein
LRANLVPTQIQAAIEMVSDGRENNGINIELWSSVVADQMSDADFVCAQKLALDSGNTTISTSDLKNRLDPRVLLNQLAGDLRAEVGAPAQSGRERDAIESCFLVPLSPGD